MRYKFEWILDADPTLRFFIREAKIENDWHLKLRIAALTIAMNRFCDKLVQYESK